MQTKAYSLIAGKRIFITMLEHACFRVIFDETEEKAEFDKFRCWDLRKIEEFGFVIMRVASDWTGDKTKLAFGETRIFPSPRYEFVR